MNSSANHNAITKRAAALGLAVALGAGALGGATVHAIEGGDAGITAEAVHNIAQKEAYSVAVAERLAEHYAEEINKVRSSGKTVNDMHFLNGAVRDKADFASPNSESSTNPRYFHRNLILLTLRDDENKAGHDSDGKFLNGAYLGTLSFDLSGKAEIGVIPFNSEIQEFIAYDPDEIVIVGSAEVFEGKDGPALSVLDNTLQPRMNPDGTLFSPMLASN